MAQHFTVKAESNAELRAFLQAIEWVDDDSLEIVVYQEQDPSTKEALIIDKKHDGGDVVINVPVRDDD